MALRLEVERALSDFEKTITTNIIAETDAAKKASALNALGNFLIARAKLNDAIKAIPLEFEPVITREELPDVLVDSSNQAVKVDDRWIDLGPKSFKVFKTLAERQGEPLSTKEIQTMGVKKPFALIWQLRVDLKENPDEPKYIASEPGKGYIWLGGRIREAGMETPRAEKTTKTSLKQLAKEVAPKTQKLYSVPYAANEVGIASWTLITWCEQPELMRKGVHYKIVGGKERKQRRITEAGVERARHIAKIRGQHRQLKGPELAQLLRKKEPKGSRGTPAVPAEALLNPAEVEFSNEETLKLADRLTRAKLTIAEQAGVNVSDAVAAMWEEFTSHDGAFEEAPEKIIASLDKKLNALSAEPVSQYQRFQGNLAVQETLLILEKVQQNKRFELIKALLYPQGYTEDHDGFVQPGKTFK